MAKKPDDLSEFVEVHHPDLKLQARVSRGAFIALKEKGWKLGELPATKGGGS